MTLAVAILWAAFVSATTWGGAWIVRRSGRSDALLALYVTLVTFSAIAASKPIAFDLGFSTIYAPGAVLIFSVTFLLLDIVNERFGKREAQRMITLALFAQIALAAFSYLIVRATPAPFFLDQEAIETLLGSVPRIIVAGLLAFYVSEHIDAHLFHWFKMKTRGKHLWMRNAFSSLPAMFLDSAIFVTVAFLGTAPLVPLIVGLTTMKWLVGVIDIPFMYAARSIAGTIQE
jgi:uncharacterized integral membrane protein (TIGR00697 family)